VDISQKLFYISIIIGKKSVVGSVVGKDGHHELQKFSINLVYCKWQ